METRSQTAQPPAKLERLGRYRIIRPLSKGGMALVYEARRESLAGVSPRVAIKLILPEHASSDTFQELFINEARLGASMHHQNLVQIQDFDRDGDMFFLVMEYVEGLTLRRMVSLCHHHGISIPLGVIAEAGRQACDGLHYAHQASDEEGTPLSLVHRDMKPSNLILNPQGVVKVLDFGISKGRLLKERKGAVKGTWGYMAPEQAMGAEVLPTADVFGLATVLYEMAALGSLFKGKKPAEIKRLLADDHAARMAALLDPSYGPLISVLVRALQRDPHARYPSAAAFGRALSSLLPDPITARDEVVRFYQVCNALREGKPVPAPEARFPFGPDIGAIPVSSAPRSIPPSSLARSQPTPSEGPEREDRGVFGLVAVVAIATLLVLSLAVGAAVVGATHFWKTQEATTPTVDVSDVLPDTPPPPPIADEPPGPAGVDAPGEVEEIIPPGPEQDPRPPAARGVPERTVAPPVTVEPTPEPTPAPEPVVEPEPDPPEEPVRVVVVRRTPPEETTETDTPVVVTVPEPEPVVAVPDEPSLLTISATQPAEVYVDGKFIRNIPVVRREFEPGSHIVTIVAEDGRRKSFDVSLAPGEELRRVWDFDRGEWRR